MFLQMKGEGMAGSKKNTKTRRMVLFGVEILVLFLFLGGLFLYGQFTSRLQKMGKPQVTEIQYTSDKQEETQIKVNEAAPTMTGFRTYALFGLDHREKNEELSGYNSDTIIIAAIDNDSKDVRLASVYRDTLLDIGDEVYAKANAAYAYGGPLQAVNALNRNLDLKITDYVSVDFGVVVALVDAVGGIDVPLSYAEIVHLNNYCLEVSEETGKSYVPIALPEKVPEDQEAMIGTYHLNGVQATSYCRIRYTASLDMGRTERQRRVIQLVVQKLKKVGVTGILGILDELLPMVSTSLNVTEILSMVPSLINYGLNSTTGFPFDYKFSNFRGDVIVPDTLEANVVKLHSFLYGKDSSYSPSVRVTGISQTILEIVGGENSLQVEQPQVTEEDTGSSIIWSQNTTGVYTPTDNSSYFGGEDTYEETAPQGTGVNTGTSGGTTQYQPSYSDDLFDGDDDDVTPQGGNAGQIPVYVPDENDNASGVSDGNGGNAGDAVYEEPEPEDVGGGGAYEEPIYEDDGGGEEDWGGDVFQYEDELSEDLDL